MRQPGMRILLCLLLGGVGVYVGAWLGLTFNVVAGTDATVDDEGPHTAKSNLQSADPRLSPEQVVHLQVDALRRFSKVPSAIHQCFVLASPANRAVTGPLDKFAEMVLSPTYQALVYQNTSLIGRPVIRGAQASVLVSVLNEDRTTSIFRFYLTKQSDPLHLDCWMTDAVIHPTAPKQPISGTFSEPTA